MEGFHLLFRITCVLGLLALTAPEAPAQPTGGGGRFRVATWNLENYLLAPVPGRVAKSAESQAQVIQTLLALRADVLAVQEIGGKRELESLQTTLRQRGLDYPGAELAWGHDPAIGVALLSRFPILRITSHTNESYLLLGRRFHVSRAFLEAELEPAPGYRLTVICAHLKSRRTSLVAEESDLREEEARILRALATRLLEKTPGLNLVVLGDLNDTQDSRTLRTLVGKGGTTLIDTRPPERNPLIPPTDGEQSGRAGNRTITWTHHFGKEDTYSRIDYILISRGLYHEWVREDSFVAALPGWGQASDHRPVVATFHTREKGFLPSPPSRPSRPSR